MKGEIYRLLRIQEVPGYPLRLNIIGYSRSIFLEFTDNKSFKDWSKAILMHIRSPTYCDDDKSVNTMIPNCLDPAFEVDTKQDMFSNISKIADSKLLESRRKIEIDQKKLDSTVYLIHSV